MEETKIKQIKLFGYEGNIGKTINDANDFLTIFREDDIINIEHQSSENHLTILITYFDFD